MSTIRINLDSNAQELVNRFRVLPVNVRNGVRGGLADALLITETRVRTGTSLKWRRGGAGLSGRLTSYARNGGELGIDAAIGFRKTAGFPYELAQEFGAHAKPGGAMAIPVSPIARAMSDRGQGPRDWAPGTIFRLPNTRVLVENPGPGAENILHYVLVKSIPPRLKFRETVNAQAGLISQQILAGARRGAAQS